MADFQTQCRLYGYKYSSPEIAKSSPSYKDTYHETAPTLFKTPRVQVHDCRPETLQDFRDKHLWEAYLFKHGLNKTCDDVKELHYKPKEETPPGRRRKPDKLLYCVGNRGSGQGDFCFPRGLATEVGGDIIVADTKNHRLQVFNQCGVYKNKLGCKGADAGQFNEPIGVSIMFNGDVAVADRRNKRIQVFDSEYEFKFSFATVDAPYYVACDDEYNILVSTEAGTVEVYRRQAKLLQRFSVGSSGPAPIVVNDKQEAIVSDVNNNLIKFFTYTGKLLCQFQPAGSAEGLACCPTSLCLNPVGQILIADGLNHTVNLYTERGFLVEQLVGPTDEAGSGQACAVGSEGHLVTTEFTSNGAHCLKIFRYRDCECHRTRPNSSKRSNRSETYL